MTTDTLSATPRPRRKSLGRLVATGAALAGLAIAGRAMAEDPAGDWIGALRTPGGGALRVAVHIHRTPAGGYAGALDSLDQNARGIPLADVASDGKRLSFAVPAIGGRYEGVWNEGGKAWSGTLNQGGVPMLLTLARGVAPAAEPIAYRQSPWPYAEREVTVAVSGTGVRLAGVLTTPRGAGPFPAAVLIAGSGRNNRDETVFGHPIFAVIADHLARRGIAVLRYDKRGVGASTGDYAVATSADFAADADSAADFLAAQSKIDARHVGLIGHSEGGVIAPMVAQGDRRIAFVILLAGPGVPGDALIMAQQRRLLEVSGAPAAVIEQKAEQERRILDAVEKAPDHTAAMSAAAAEFRAMGVPEAQIDAQARQAGSDWFRFFLKHDPAPALRALRVPVLAVIGAKDVQVPADQNLPALRAALSGNPAATVVELPGLNHLFQTAATGSPAEYGQIAEHMSPKALDLLSDWITSRTAAR